MEPALPKRKSLRLLGYDYGQAGYYFITVCTAVRCREVLCAVIPPVGGGLCAAPSPVHLTDIGYVVDSAIRSLPSRNPGVRVDAYCIMSDHVHLIVALEAERHRGRSLPEMIGQLKSYTNWQYQRLGAPFGPELWQASFYDHIIRNEADLAEPRRYIQNNPAARLAAHTKRRLPMKKLSIACCLAALMLLLAACAPAEGQAGRGAQEAYRLEKLNEISDMVLRREIVPQDYLRYLDGGLAQAVEGYNESTMSLKLHYSVWAEGVVENLLYSLDGASEPPPAYERTERYYQMVERISALALHPNSSALFAADPVLSFSVAREEGGSYGLWALSCHEDWYVGEALAGQAADYFVQVDALLAQLDTARAAF